MAKEQWKKVGAIVGLVSLILIVAGSLVAGGGMVVAVEKDIEAADLKIDTEIKGVVAEVDSVRVEIKGVQDNASEDRESVKELAGIVSGMKEDHAADFKELKADAHASELRDERQSTQYTQILSHMAQQTAYNKTDADRTRQIEVDMAEIKVKMKTLIPE